MDIYKFEVLEEKISAILNQMAELTQEKESLVRKLAETSSALEYTQKELTAAQEKILTMSADRSAVLNRIETLLERLS